LLKRWRNCASRCERAINGHEDLHDLTHSHLSKKRLVPRGQLERVVGPIFVTVIFIAATCVALVASQTYIAKIMLCGGFAAPGHRGIHRSAQPRLDYAFGAVSHQVRNDLKAEGAGTVKRSQFLALRSPALTRAIAGACLSLLRLSVIECDTVAGPSAFALKGTI